MMTEEEEKTAEEVEEERAAKETTKLRRSSSSSSSSSSDQTSSEDDRSRATSPASTESQGEDDLIGCIPEEPENCEEIQQDREEKIMSRDTSKGRPQEAGSHATAARSDMDLLKAILLDGPPPRDDVIPEEAEHGDLNGVAGDKETGQSEIHPNKESHHENQDKNTIQFENQRENRHEKASESRHENADVSHRENEDESHHENVDKSHYENVDESHHHENADDSHHENADESHHENADGSHHHENADESHHENVDESHHENAYESHPENADESHNENAGESYPDNADESHNENAGESHPENADESHEEGNKSRSEAKPPKKCQQKKKKKKLQQQSPNPEPWSRAAIKSFSRRVARADASPSDRSTSIATADAGSVGVPSRGSRGLSAKELRTKFRPVSNEEKLDLRLHELDSLLAIDYAKEARMAYQRSVAECQQSWQNYVSTTRIMGDVAHPDQRQHQQYPAAAAATANGLTNGGQQSHHPLGPRIAPALTSSAILRNQETHQDDNNNANNNENNGNGRDNLQQLHSYRVGAPVPSGGRFGSDHKLSECSNPEVRAWLKEKNRSARRQRKETREAKRREMQDRLDAMQKRSNRKLEAEASFQDWVRQKQRQLQLLESEKAGKAGGSTRAPAAKANQHETLPLADQESLFAELEQHRPSPPGPKPVHNSVFKRSSSSLGIAGASFSGRQVRMGVVGRRVPESPAVATTASALLAIVQQPDEGTSAAPAKLSFADWSNRKAVQMSADRRRQQQMKAAEAAAAASADPQMAALVPKLARQRIRVAAELKSRRTDTGLGLSRPKTAVPALCAPVLPVAVRPRPTTGRVRSSLMERREAEITSDLPNPFVTPADDVMLDGILGTMG